MGARTPFGFGEWYHCYSRGVDKRVVFDSNDDYRRFMQLLYLTNSTSAIHRSTLNDLSHEELLAVERGDTIIEIGAYCLMPNHFHLLIRESTEGGISRFMQRLGTAYTMYFNKKNERVGNLFVKPFRAKHVSDERYFRYVAQYIHLNPAEIYEPGWKAGHVSDFASLESRLRRFPYSSLTDYHGEIRIERNILSREAAELIGESLPALDSVLEEAALYYREIKATP